MSHTRRLGPGVRVMRYLIPFLLSCGPLTLAGCGDSPAETAGYWEGSGQVRETLMDDGFKKLTRSAEFEFWFNLDEDGNAVGEVEVFYDAVLNVKDLPQITVPTPGSGSVTFAPAVGGKMVDPDPSRRLLLVGVLKNDKLHLTAQGGSPLKFVLRADPGISVGLSVGAASVGASADSFGEISETIAMTAFSPFNGAARVEKRPNGPYAARYEARGESTAPQWTARQLRSEQRQHELTAEMETALEELRRELAR